MALLNSSVPNVLAAGSSRVGKSWLFMIFCILVCRFYPGVRIGIFRRNRNACDANLFKLTLVQALKVMGLKEGEHVTLNKQDLTCTFLNTSQLIFNGLDENQRDKVLGSEFQIIWMNEVSEFVYEDVEFLRGRLYGEVHHKDTGVALQHRMLFDCNPDTFDDWDYKLFEQKIHPIKQTPLLYPQDYAYHRLVTDDVDYIRRNADQSDEWKERFIYARWQASNPDAIFNKKTINEFRVLESDVPVLKRIVVAIDPATTANKNSDKTGIIVAGVGYNNEAYVLEDLSGKYHPEQWAAKALEAFDRWEADKIVIETNQGGDMAEQNIRQLRRNAPVEQVRATRGKEVRADPVATAYKKGQVHHVGRLDELEMEMCSFGGPRAASKSPDRMDALVWAIYALLDIAGNHKPTYTQTVAVSGHWR